MSLLYFFFNDTPTTEIYTLSLHDALPICGRTDAAQLAIGQCRLDQVRRIHDPARGGAGTDDGVDLEPDQAEIGRHTSELQSQSNLVCRLLLEKKKTTN